MKTRLFFQTAILVSVLSGCNSIDTVQDIYIPMDGQGDAERRMTMVTAGTTDYTSRTVLDDGQNGSKTLFWSGGDKIRVSDGKTEAVYTTQDSGKQVAEFVNDNAALDATAKQFTAYYPETLSATTLVLPAVQNYVEDGMTGFPMMAVSSTRELTFRNLCGVLCLRVKTNSDTGVSISKVVLASPDAGLSGKFTVSDFTAVVTDSGTDITLQCSPAAKVVSEEYTDFYIYLPAGKYDTLGLTLAAEDGSEAKLVSGGAVNIVRSTVCRMSVVLDTTQYNGSLEGLPVVDDGQGFVPVAVHDSSDGLFSVTTEDVDMSVR